MSELQKGRWLDRAFQAVLVLLVGLWMLYPPQRIGETPQGPAPGRQAASPSSPALEKPALAKTWSLR
jgi:hypothetical protein